MDFSTIDDLYRANDVVRERFRKTVSGLAPIICETPPVGEEWSIAQIVEHVAMVNAGIARICARLLSKAESAGITNDGKAHISLNFSNQGKEVANKKLEAPEMVRPVSGKSIEESIAELEISRKQLSELKLKFIEFGATEPKFPHPFFGDLSAQEWLALVGFHENRHLKQIERFVEKFSDTDSSSER